MFQIQLCYFIFMGLISNARGSAVVFEATPSVVLEHITQSVFMRCSIHDDASGTNNIRHVTSMFVTNPGGDDVATVTAFDAPAALASSLQVKGSVSGVSSEGYIELSWSDPANMTMGQYTCTVDAIDTKGHHVVLTAELETTSETPSMVDLIEDINSKYQHQQQINQQLEQKLRACSSHVAFMAAMSQTRFASGHAGHAFTMLAGQPVLYDDVLLNAGGNYDKATGAFTCVVSGLYSFQSHAMNSDEHEIAVSMFKNSDIVVTSYAGSHTNYEGDSVSAVVHLDAGDVVKMVTRRTSTFHEELNLHNSNVFSGHLVKADGCRS